MSLNGLDSDAVVQAHQNSLSEAGGWFLLKYAARDTVELLDSGTGGVSEARRAIDGYEQKSPVYGLVQYRRKRFILKYVPDGTSRLLQVRLAVQFQSIVDTFTPHDTIFSFTTAEELSESALGVSSMLQSTASKSSSSSSLQQERLKEIAEDNEEVSTTETLSKVEPVVLPTANQQVTEAQFSDDALPLSAVRAKAILAQRREQSRKASTSSVQTIPQGSQIQAEVKSVPSSPSPAPAAIVERFPPRSSSIVDKDLPLPPTEDSSPLQRKEADSIVLRPSLDFSIPAVESDSDDDVRRPVPKEYNQVRYSQHLTAAESTSISQWSNEVQASTRSKQTSGPRPHEDMKPRPKTSGNPADSSSSRRANLPSSVRVSSRVSIQSSRPGSQQSARSVPTRWVPSSNLPPPLPSPTFPDSSTQRHLPKLAKAPSQTSSLADNPAVTPEKMRLMKALQMRKRNQLLAQRSASAPYPTLNTLASTDSSHSGLSAISTAPSTDPQNRNSVSQPPELASINESQTTSPTSIVSPSERHSTKPSSLGGNSARHQSQTSLSSDTHSSTTPRAETRMTSQDNSGQQQALDDGLQSPGQVNRVDAQQSTDTTAPVPSALPALSPIQRPNSSVPLTTRNDMDDQSVVQLLESGSALEQTWNRCEPLEPAMTKSTQKRYQFEGRITIPTPSIELTDESEDDDSFMEELQSATVQEARSMSVNRTPVTPVLSKVPTREFRDSTPVLVAAPKSRTVSDGSRASTPDRRRTASRAGSTRSVSGALPQWPPPPNEPVPSLPKQRTQMSAGISRRVKTFEGLSQQDSLNASGTRAKDLSARGSKITNMLRRASFLPQSNGQRTPEPLSPTSPAPAKSEYVGGPTEANSRPMVQRQGTVTEVYSPTHKGESVTVTARIIRDATKSQTGYGTSDTSGMHWSPLIVEHETDEVSDERPPLPRELTTQSMDSLPAGARSGRRRFSLSSHRTGGKSLSPVDRRSNRFSFTPHKKQSRAPSEASSITDDKRASRTTRMFKRLSGMGKSRNKEASLIWSAQESLHAGTIEEQHETADVAMRSVVDIGEVNVQFPDTLLWKRRFLRVDNKGYLMFAPPTNDFSAHGKSLKIHLDELCRPTLPEVEREEMAWSIILDLRTGGTVQCACESKAAQRSVLKMLLDAHKAYNQLYAA